MRRARLAVLLCTARMVRQHIDISRRLSRSAIVRFAIGYGAVDSSFFLHVYFRSCCLSASCSAIEIPILSAYHLSVFIPVPSPWLFRSFRVIRVYPHRLADVYLVTSSVPIYPTPRSPHVPLRLQSHKHRVPPNPNNVHVLKMKTITAMAINFLVAAFTNPPNPRITPYPKLPAQQISSGSDPALVGWIDVTDGQCKRRLVLQQIRNFLI